MPTFTERVEWEILRRINEARANPQEALESRGLGDLYNADDYPARGPLRMNIALRGAAQGWAQLMADQDEMNHNLDGRSDQAEGTDAYADRFGVRPMVLAVIHWHSPIEGDVADDAERTVRGWLASDGGHRDIILSDTPLAGFGVHESGSGKLYVSGMLSTAPGGFVDLYVKDNEADEGLVPSTGLTYLSPAIRVKDAMDELRENIEYGEDNYVFVEVLNAGTRPPDAYDVYLYWADPGTNLIFDPANPTADAWNEEGICVEGVIDQNWIHVAGPQLGEIGPFVWCPPDPGTALGREGHFCLFARVVSTEDPIMHEGDRDYENNVAQRNVTVYNATEEGECSCPIDLGGGSLIDVTIDSAHLIEEGGKVYFRIRSNLLADVSFEGFSEERETTPGGQITTLECTQPVAEIRGIYLGTGQTSRCELRARLPSDVVDGTVYPVVVGQNVGDRHVGSVTMVARIVGTPAYIGNSNSGEIHYPDCQWVSRMSSRNKVPFNSIEVAHKRRYDNCAFCLGGSHR